MKHRILYSGFLSILVALTAASIYITAITVRSLPFYTDLKQQGDTVKRAGKESRHMSFDSEIGPVPAAFAKGESPVPKGEPIPFLHDKNGMRIPESTMSHQPDSPKLLFLGDSFTYGTLVHAENTFPFKTASAVGGVALNSGGNGYGLAQMVLQARRLIPKHRPDYVIVQYSPWLAIRSQSELATEFSSGSGAGIIMAPYFYDKPDGAAISPVPFNPPEWIFDRAEKFLGTPVTLADKARFITTFAIPLIWHRDRHIIWLRVKQWAGQKPKPSTNTDTIIRSAYSEISALSKKHGAQMIVLVLGGKHSFRVDEHLFPTDTIGVHAWAAMVSRLYPQDMDEYVRRYYIWRGDPPEPVDFHPNEKAHSIIAEALVDRLQTIEKWRLEKNGQP